MHPPAAAESTKHPATETIQKRNENHLKKRNGNHKTTSDGNQS